LAALSNKVEVFRYLIERGADINIREIENNTVLHGAAASNNVEIVKILLDK
jgi:ankyrin repeat protein